MKRDFMSGLDNSAATGPSGGDPYAANGGPIPVPLHPFSLGETRIGARLSDLTPVEAVELFAQRISQNLTKDYGDWMRDANFYWWDLASSLREQNGVWDLMNGLHEVIQFASDWQPIETCRLALELSMEIRERLGVIDGRQPHDYGISETEMDLPTSN
jgi:hypothetical protein